jgi:hypothetical protein
MSSLKITNISNKNNNSGAVISGISTVSSGNFTLPSGTTGQRVGIESGSLRYNTTDNILEFYTGTSWLAISQTSTSLFSRGLFGGGLVSPALLNVIDYITIATTGNATDFGDLTVARTGLVACSNSHGGLS